jgi:hypothetical protein
MRVVEEEEETSRMTDFAVDQKIRKDNGMRERI